MSSTFFRANQSLNIKLESLVVNKIETLSKTYPPFQMMSPAGTTNSRKRKKEKLRIQKKRITRDELILFYFKKSEN